MLLLFLYGLACIVNKLKADRSICGILQVIRGRFFVPETKVIQFDKM